MKRTDEEKALAANIERIVIGPGTKADRARELFALGCERTDVTELLEMSYSQAHSIWKHLGEPPKPRRIGAKGQRAAESVSRHGSNLLQFSPTQVRYITQNGHMIHKVDMPSGVECRNCREPLTYSIFYQGFVHKFSNEEPTASEDHYAA